MGERFKCSLCRQNPRLKDAWGCEAPMPLEVQPTDEKDGIQYRYVNCPVKFVPDSAYQFEFLYNDCLRWKQIPALEERSARFIMAYMYYERKLSEYTEEMKNG